MSNKSDILGQIMMFAGNYAPKYWAFCDGRSLRIDQYQALFSIIGTTYGGDGKTHFALPDMRTLSPVHPDGKKYVRGGKTGDDTVTLTSGQVPRHSHLIAVNSSDVEGKEPANAFFAAGGNYADTAQDNVFLNAAAVQPSAAFGPHPFSIVQPFLVLNFIICTDGIFPPRRE